MKKYGLFDIIGPRMTGPSSSHTAGAVRIGKVACCLCRGDMKKAEITLYGSFAETGRGHGTDKALIAGLLDFSTDDERIRKAPELAAERGIQIQISYAEEETVWPNTARIVTEDSQGNKNSLVGASVGGGSIEILQINDMDVSFGCAYPTLLVFHRDMPGMISRVTYVLAQHQVNIAFMKVFRSTKRQNACMVIETDEEPEAAVLDEILALGGEIYSVYQFKAF